MRSVIRYCITALLTLILLGCAGTARASADAISEPYGDSYEDSFYRKHREDCRYEKSRHYVANGPDGHVDVYKNPTSLKKVANTIENGTTYYLDWFYTDEDGIEWTYIWTDDAWAPMSYFAPGYDHICWIDDNRSDIDFSDFGTADIEITDTPVNFFEFPGSVYFISLELGPDWAVTYNGSYTDPAGRRWVRADYYYGVTDHWVCVTSPYAAFTELYPEGSSIIEDAGERYNAGLIETPEPIAKLKSKTSKRDRSDRDRDRDRDTEDTFKLGTIIAVAVLIVVAITGAVLIIISARRRAARSAGSSGSVPTAGPAASTDLNSSGNPADSDAP